MLPTAHDLADLGVTQRVVEQAAFRLNDEEELLLTLNGSQAALTEASTTNACTLPAMISGVPRARDRDC